MENKMLNRLIGVDNDRDEYQLQEIYKELASAGALMWYLSIGVMGICLLVDTFNHTLSVGTIGLLIVNMIYASKVFIRVRKKELDSMECANEAEYKEKLKVMRKGGFKGGLLFGFYMTVMNVYLFPFIAGDRIELTWRSLIIQICVGLFFGVAMYFVGKSKIKKCY